MGKKKSTFQDALMLTDKGYRDLKKAIAACTLTNFSMFIPAMVMLQVVMELLKPFTGGSISWTNMWIYFGLGIIGAVIVFLCNKNDYKKTYVASYMESENTRIALAEHIRKLPMSVFNSKNLSELTTNLMGDVATSEHVLSHVYPQIISNVITITVVCIMFAFYDWRMALAAVWVLPIAFAITLLSARIQEYFNRKSVAANVALEDGVQECIENLQELKANNAEDSYLAGLDKKIDHVEKRHIISELGTALFVVSSTLILKFGIATVALTGSVLLIGGEIEIPMFFMFLLVASRLYAPLEGALQNLAAVISTKTNINRMNEILDHPIQTGSSTLTNKGCDIVFDHVGFAYNSGETVLKDVSFTAKQGEVTALVGPSGGGKTTVSRLAARFWDIQKGKITVGGMDISKIDPETLMSLYSIVFQDVTLFNNTIMENIRIGRKDATDEEVIAAARLANCEEFALKLPDGYNSMIGENGCELSGGERQRISIARAFLKDAPIILLDEATASLDVENETHIQAALSRLIKDKTVLVIAHRMRTVSGADKVVVLSGGTVAEQGTPETLMHTGKIYPHMVKLQMQSQKWGI